MPFGPSPDGFKMEEVPPAATGILTASTSLRYYLSKETTSTTCLQRSHASVSFDTVDRAPDAGSGRERRPL